VLLLMCGCPQEADSVSRMEDGYGPESRESAVQDEACRLLPESPIPVSRFIGGKMVDPKQVSVRRFPFSTILRIPAFLLLFHIFFLGVSGNTALGQSITGRVASEIDVAPIAGADVILEGTRFRTMSDSLGEFALRGLTPGSYILLVRSTGYITVRDSIDVMGTDQGEILVLLAPDPIEMDSLQVIALTEAERRQRAAGSTHYVALGREDLARLNDRGAVRVSDLFRRDLRLSRWIRHDLTGNGVLSGGLCLQYPRPGPRTVRSETDRIISGCRFPATYLDDAYVPASPGLLEEYPTSEIYSIELMPPSEAVYRYGRQAANGALVVTTMMGAAEAAARRSAIDEDQRRHWKYLGVGTAVGIFASFGYALSNGFFDSGVDFNSEVLPVAGVTVFSIGLGEVLYRIRGRNP